MFTLLDEINPLKLCANTLLFDSWFAYPSIIKRSSKVHYTYGGKAYTLNQLYKKVRKNAAVPKFSPRFLLDWGHDENGEEVQARIIFVRDQNRSKKWLALLTTNLDHTDEDAVRIRTI
jgi:hypothetical protein